MSTLSSIVYRPDNVPAHPEAHFSRVPLEQAQLLEGYGIEGDRKGGHPDRHLNLMSRETMDQLAEEGFKTGPGELGEQLVLENLDSDLNTLAAGTRLQIGDEAVIELVKPRTGCDRFEAIQGLPRTDAAMRLGMMARVVQSGAIRVGDEVKILQYV